MARSIVVWEKWVRFNKNVKTLRQLSGFIWKCSLALTEQLLICLLVSYGFFLQTEKLWFRKQEPRLQIAAFRVEAGGKHDFINYKSTHWLILLEKNKHLRANLFILGGEETGDHRPSSCRSAGPSSAEEVVVVGARGEATSVALTGQFLSPLSLPLTCFFR